MRRWGKLSRRGKSRRVWHAVVDFFRLTIWGDYKRGGIRGAYHWVRCHVWNRYHLIDLRGHADYDWGWIDRDHAMWIACFALLVDYVEKENPFEFINWESDDGHSNAAKEIRALYEWWKTGRKTEHDAHRAMPVDNYRGPSWDAWCAENDRLEAKDEEMLDRLMKIRGYLWT